MTFIAIIVIYHHRVIKNHCLLLLFLFVQQGIHLFHFHTQEVDNFFFLRFVFFLILTIVNTRICATQNYSASFLVTQCLTTLLALIIFVKQINNRVCYSFLFISCSFHVFFFYSFNMLILLFHELSFYYYSFNSYFL